MCAELHTFAKGFKNARKNALDKNGKHFTQKSFADAFNISIDTVKNWEQGRTTPEIKDIYRLCDFFHCDMDYLFDRLDCSTHNIKYISDYTGLDENAISKLNKTNEAIVINKQLSKLINSDSFASFMLYIREYINADLLYVGYLTRLENALKEYEEIDEKDELSEDELLTIAAKYANENKSCISRECYDVLNARNDRGYCSYNLQKSLIDIEESFDSFEKK